MLVDSGDCLPRPEIIEDLRADMVMPRSTKDFAGQTTCLTGTVLCFASRGSGKCRDRSKKGKSHEGGTRA
jgi:hypothetical protein